MLTLAGCASPSRDTAYLDRELRARTGVGLPTSGDEAPADLESQLAAASVDGLDEDELVALALAHNPTYRADLTRLAVAAANFDEAQRPANPQLSVLGPLGPVTAIATLIAPLESLWQLPQRTEAASRELESIADSLVMNGLTAARDVVLAGIEVSLARERLAVRRELAEVATEMARLGDARARFGETSPLDADVLRADAVLATDALALVESEQAIMEARLAAQLGVTTASRVELVPSPRAVDDAAWPDVESLWALALRMRPDVRAAELAIEGASARAGWERGRAFPLALAADAQWSAPTGPSLRFGPRIEIPIFGANPGGIGRAEADIRRAQATLLLTRATVRREVTEAWARARYARAAERRFVEGVLPELDDALRVARAGFETGEETYLVVLDVLRRVADARLRRAELGAETRRARAELERAIGGRLVRANDVSGDERRAAR